MNRYITRIWAPIAVLVDALLIIDIATDLVKKYKDRKAQNNTEPEAATEPVTAE